MRKLPHHFRQRRQVVNILHTLAHRLQDDRERGVVAGDVEKLLRTLALLPQRRTLARIASRQKQRTRRTLPETGGEQRRIAHLISHDVCDLIGIKGKQRRIWGRLALRQAQHDAIIARHGLRVHPCALRHALPHRQGPCRIDRPAKRGVQHHAPIPQLIGEALQQQRLLIRDEPRSLVLLLQISGDVAAG